MPERSNAPLRVFTVGHSTHPIDEFTAMLIAHGVKRLVDVRTIPRSRRNPQFSTDSLAAELTKHGIEYVHMKALGGLRKPRKNSVNTGWRNESFRGYADYMATKEFQQGIDSLVELAGDKCTTVMCAEAVPWRCHRSLIGDALLARGIDVADIMNAKDAHPHKLTTFAHVEGRHVTYPAAATSFLFK